MALRFRPPAAESGSTSEREDTRISEPKKKERSFSTFLLLSSSVLILFLSWVLVWTNVHGCEVMKRYDVPDWSLLATCASIDDDDAAVDDEVKIWIGAVPLSSRKSSGVTPEGILPFLQLPHFSDAVVKKIARKNSVIHGFIPAARATHLYKLC
ncbi:hypothetical protein Bca4012_017540 [Brassica carinata]|uniref:Uncharacterized protein n=1 Tax=Brassica carinata TaxID=52824 RepID=A0A8X7WP95_BRACI|nr:hypothetical protein Bca52824_004005 [Brassica carinata]